MWGVCRVLAAPTSSSSLSPHTFSLLLSILAHTSLLPPSPPSLPPFPSSQLTMVLVIILELVFQDLNLLHHIRHRQGSVRMSPIRTRRRHPRPQHEAGCAVVRHILCWGGVVEGGGGEKRRRWRRRRQGQGKRRPTRHLAPMEYVRVPVYLCA